MDDETNSTWDVEVELFGHLTDEQMEQVAGDTFATRYNSHSGSLTLHGRVTADNLRQALTAAEAWFNALPTVQAFIRARVLGEPQGLMVASPTSRAWRLDILGPSEVATRLGVSTARVRQLANEPDFPEPFTELEGGRLWRATDIDAYAQARNPKPGRPPKGTR